jgi:hypothetical protein
LSVQKAGKSLTRYAQHFGGRYSQVVRRDDFGANDSIVTCRLTLANFRGTAGPHRADAAALTDHVASPTLELTLNSKQGHADLHF